MNPRASSSTADNYILRIARRYANDASRLEGVVELVANGEKIAFHDALTLWRILITGRNEISSEATPEHSDQPAIF